MKTDSISFFVTKRLYPDGSQGFNLSTSSTNYPARKLIIGTPATLLAEEDDEYSKILGYIQQSIGSSVKSIDINERMHYRVLYNREYKTSGSIMALDPSDKIGDYRNVGEDEIPLEKEDILYWMKIFHKLFN